MKKILIICSAVFLVSCGGKSTDKKAELEKLKKERVELNSKITALEAEVGTSSAAEDVTDVSILEVAESSFSNYLEVQGRIDAEENVQVNPEAQGMVTAVYV